MLSIASCEKQKISPLPQNHEYIGEVTALKNNVTWNAKVRAIPNFSGSKGFSLEFRRYNTNGDMLEGISTYNIQPIEGRQILYNTKSANRSDSTGSDYYTLVDGDVVEDSYILDENKESFILIQQYDSESNTIKGEFEIYTVIEIDGPVSPGDPEVRFTSGVFLTRINPEWIE